MLDCLVSACHAWFGFAHLCGAWGFGVQYKLQRWITEHNVLPVENVFFETALLPAEIPQSAGWHPVAYITLCSEYGFVNLLWMRTHYLCS